MYHQWLHLTSMTIHLPSMTIHLPSMITLNINDYTLTINDQLSTQPVMTSIFVYTLIINCLTEVLKQCLSWHLYSNRMQNKCLHVILSQQNMQGFPSWPQLYYRWICIKLFCSLMEKSMNQKGNLLSMYMIW